MSEDLRHRYAEALAATNALDNTDLEYTLDLVMAVRGDELEQLRLIARVNHGLHRSADEDAVQAAAAIVRVRALHVPFRRRDDIAYCDHCSVSAGSEWRRYVLVPWPCPTLAALDNTPEGDHGH